MKTDATRPLINYNAPSSQYQQSSNPTSQGSGPEIKPGNNPFGSGKADAWQNRPQGFNGPLPVTPVSAPTLAPQAAPIMRGFSAFANTQNVATGTEPSVKSYNINPNAQATDTAADKGGANGFLESHWTIPSQSGALTNIHFPMQISDSAARGTGSTPGGQYFAQYIDFRTPEGLPHPDGPGGYIGIQPSTEEGKGYAVFSGWGKGVSTTTGHSLADGDPGASNSTKFDFQYGHKYVLSAETSKKDPNTLNGFVQDVTDPNHPGSKTLIGDLKFQHPVRISNHNAGFVEQFGSNTSNSSQIHRASGEFGAPYTENKSGKTQGTISSWSPYGNYQNSITGTTTVTTDYKNGVYNSSFDVSGAGWKLGTKIPGINTDTEIAEYNPKTFYSRGELVTYNGNIFSSRGSAMPNVGTPAPNGDFISGFNWVKATPKQNPLQTSAPDNTPASNAVANPSNAQTGNPNTGLQQSQQPQSHPAYDDSKQYQPGDMVTLQGHVFVKTPDGSTKSSPDGYSIPGFNFV
jgi:hypothetical protein